VIGHPPEHLLDGFGRFAVVSTAHVTTNEDLSGIISKVYSR
jgi:hypothetical protein